MVSFGTHFSRLLACLVLVVYVSQTVTFIYTVCTLALMFGLEMPVVILPNYHAQGTYVLLSPIYSRVVLVVY